MFARLEHFNCFGSRLWLDFGICRKWKQPLVDRYNIWHNSKEIFISLSASELVSAQQVLQTSDFYQRLTIYICCQFVNWKCLNSTQWHIERSLARWRVKYVYRRGWKQEYLDNSCYIQQWVLYSKDIHSK